MPRQRAHHPKLRRFGKWAGLTLLILVLTAAVLSAWQTYRFMCTDNIGAPCGLWGLSRGGIEGWWMNFPKTADSTFEARSNDWQINWGFEWQANVYNNFTSISFFIPLWAPALLIAIPTAWLWWRDRPSRRRTIAGLCPRCGYDRTGLPTSAPCPECGKLPAPAPAPAA